VLPPRRRWSSLSVVVAWMDWCSGCPCSARFCCSRRLRVSRAPWERCNRHLGAGLDRAIEAIQQGTALHRALRSEVTLPAIALQMISVGEEAGKLDRMLVRVALMLERQIQASIDRFMAALTPALTVGIALMVGAMIMPVMNAVLSINDLAAR
jgi:type II secretory pathway component PulF